MTQQSDPPVQELSQETYRESQYEDVSWEIVGEFLNQERFEPLGFQVVNVDVGATTDPMFADYGGIPDDRTSERYHGADKMTFNPGKRSVTNLVEEQEVQFEARLDEMQKEFEAKIEAAKREGFEAGRLAATEEIDQRNKVIEDRYAQVLEDVGLQISDNIKQIENQSVDLSVQIARKLIGTCVDINPEYILDIVRESIRLSGGAVIQSIKVSPQDHEFLTLLNLPKQFKEYDGTWQFERDDTVASGCIVITSGGEVDFQLDAAWERIKEKVARVVALNR